MDPRDVNRINYNNYYVGQNLDFLIRSKMRSESLSTPLTNTPVFYDDQVSSKMALLGKRGYYDPGYIYGFDNLNNNRRENINNNSNNKSPQKYSQYDLNEREQYLNEQKQKDNFYREQYELEMRRQKELQQNKMKYEPNNNNINDRNYDIKDVPNYRNNEEFQREYNEYLNKDKKGQNIQNNIREEGNELNLPKTREQIQHDVYIENFKRQQLAKQMMMEDEMKYRQNLYLFRNCA